MIEWIEPYDKECDIDLICRMNKADAIIAQKRHAFKMNPDFVYKSDQEALEDFMTVHWAREVEIV